MPVSPRAERLKQLQDLEKQIEISEKELDDRDWLERLGSYPEWKRLEKLYRDSQEKSRAIVEQIKEKLVSEPLTDAQVSDLRQKGLIARRDLENTEAFLGFPQNEVVRLEEIRKSLPGWKNRVNELRERLGEIVKEESNV